MAILRSLLLLVCLFGFAIPVHVHGMECSESSLMDDLLIVDYWNQRIYDQLPVTYNNLFQGGYFAMPSARMGEEGEIGIGYSWVPPYRNYNLRVQVLDRFELTGNYRVFRGVEDPILSPMGFGDLSDKGANFKVAIFSPEESDYMLPGLAFGLEDFIGTRAFHAQYLVFTQVFIDHNLEVSVGYGRGRIKGFFAGLNWMPFRRCCSLPWLQNLSLAAEFDPIPYHRSRFEPHPGGRIKKSPFNFGIKYRYFDYFDFNLSYIRGDKFSFAAGASYNFGNTEGFLPKIDDPLPYTAPVNTEPLGIRRAEEMLVPELVFAFQEQGLTLLDIYLSFNECSQKVLRLNILNETYWLECRVRDRLNHLLAALIPMDIAEVVAVIYSEGFPIQEYHFDMNFVRLYSTRQICDYELNILTPMTEVTYPDPYESAHLFQRKRHLYNFEIAPDTHTLFGSSRGKFKYSLGLNFAFNGFLWKDIYYNVLIGSTFITNMGKSQGVDRLNPSQLINVRSDVVNYYRRRGVCLDQAYLQKNWNIGRGWYSRVAGGYFEEEYGGFATELLFYPVCSDWAIGIEGAVLKKRQETGLGFTNKIRKYKGFIPTFHHFLGSQYFINLYYDWRCARLAFKITAGKFLANDWGVRNEITRYFPSGLQLTVWYTLTNGNDKINGKRYYDKGVMFSMPFDIFYTYSERSRWNYGMSAWLRDVGVQAMTGLQLYELINEQRQ